jgi:hypothetical protein
MACTNTDHGAGANRLWLRITLQEIVRAQYLALPASDRSIELVEERIGTELRSLFQAFRDSPQQFLATPKVSFISRSR